MSLVVKLQKALPHLDITRHTESLFSEHALARHANNLERRHGLIKQAHFEEHTHYLPYFAARPVAPHMGGIRSAGIQASAAWGASVAVSFLRNELPSLTMYWHQRLATPRPLVDVHLAPRRQEEKEETLFKRVLPYLPYIPLALTSYELLVGTGYADTLPPHRGVAAPQLPELLRGPGLVGLVIQKVVQTAGNQRHKAAQITLMLVACGMQVGLQVARLPALILVGAVAATGGTLGAAYGLVAYFLFAYRGRAGEQATSVAEVEQQEMQNLRRHMMQMQDDILPAPLIEALWNGRMAFAPNVNFYSNFAQQVGAAFGNGRDPFFHNARATRRPPAWAGRAFEVPLAEELPGGEQNVHAAGRDEASRRSMMKVLAAYPDVDTQAEIASILAFIRDQESENGRLSGRLHPSGQTWLSAACVVFTGDGDPAFAKFQFWPSTVDRTSTLYVSSASIRPTADIVATLWHAIGGMVAKPGSNLSTSELILRERESFVSAAARTLTDNGDRVCQNGISQALLLSLQGSVDGIEIEHYQDDEVPHLTLAQFVTWKTELAQANLSRPNATTNLRQEYDRIYAEGKELYPEQAASLADQLHAIAQYSEEDWTVSENLQDEVAAA